MKYIINFTLLFVFFSCHSHEKKVIHQEKIITEDSVVADITASSLEKAMEYPPLRIKSIFLHSHDYFPDELLNFKNLEKITFHQCSIQTIPTEARILENVWNISIIKSLNIPSGLENFQNITYISLAKNNFLNISDNLCAVKSIKRLHIFDSLFETELNPCIYTLDSLIELELCFLLINHVDSQIVNLKQLEKLVFSGTNISKIPDFLFDMSNLNNLEIEYNQLSDVEIERVRKKNSEKLKITIEQ